MNVDKFYREKSSSDRNSECWRGGWSATLNVISRDSPTDQEHLGKDLLRVGVSTDDNNNFIYIYFGMLFYQLLVSIVYEYNILV